MLEIEEVRAPILFYQIEPRFNVLSVAQKCTPIITQEGFL